MELGYQKSSECILLYLYSWDLSKSTKEELLSLVMEMLSVTKKQGRIAMEKGEKVAALVGEFDPQIDGMSLDYKAERICEIDRNILRLALYEIFHEKKEKDDVIHEAIRLAKKFSAPGAFSFVHAIIDGICKKELSSV